MARRTRPNITAIAREADVSIATVSRVLNNRAEVSEHLRQRVQSVLNSHRYRPRIVSNRTSNLAIVLQVDQPIIESFAANVLSGIAAYAFEQGVETSMLFQPAARARHEDIVRLIRERRCDAAVLLLSASCMDHLDDLVAANIPAVVVANRADQPEIGFIDTDSFSGSVALMEHLLGLGHHRIGFLTGPMSNQRDHHDRLAGYQQALSRHGIEVDPRLIIAHHPTLVTPQAGYEQATRLLAVAPDVTAIFANNDEMAFGAILACVETGRRVPEDISVVGFDDYPVSSYFNPPLTTVRQPMKEMGYEAAKYADTLVRGVIDKAPRKLLAGELVVRRSSGPAPVRA